MTFCIQNNQFGEPNDQMAKWPNDHLIMNVELFFAHEPNEYLIWLDK